MSAFQNIIALKLFSHVFATSPAHTTPFVAKRKCFLVGGAGEWRGVTSARAIRRRIRAVSECERKRMEAAEQQRSSSDGAAARGAGVPGSGGGAGPGGGAEGERDRDRATFECNICLDTARDAVISLCGHLFWYNLSIIDHNSMSECRLSIKHTPYD